MRCSLCYPFALLTPTTTTARLPQKMSPQQDIPLPECEDGLVMAADGSLDPNWDEVALLVWDFSKRVLSIGSCSCIETLPSLSFTSSSLLVALGNELRWWLCEDEGFRLMSLVTQPYSPCICRKRMRRLNKINSQYWYGLTEIGAKDIVALWAWSSTWRSWRWWLVSR